MSIRCGAVQEEAIETEMHTRVGIDRGSRRKRQGTVQAEEGIITYEANETVDLRDGTRSLCLVTV
jgi:hypothetical protein